MAIARLADVPLVEREPLELLALGTERIAVDLDWAGWGWAWVERLELAAPGRASIVLPRALVIALHSADEQVDADDIELELETADDLVRAPLSRLLAIKLPSLPKADDVVLALCNPNAVHVIAPDALAHGRLHYALGDVTSWLDRDDDGEHVRLSARQWLLARRREPR